MKTHERSLEPDDIDEAKARFLALMSKEFKGYLSEPQTEADTRSKIIDSILKNVLGWSESLIQREPQVKESGGYIDYLLSTSHPYYIIEAKKSVHQYQIPDHRTRKRYKIGGVLKEDKYLYADMRQARQYALDQGVAFCCLTNGRQFVFFRAQNDSGINWDKHVAIVFRDHSEILSSFSLFFHLLSYASVSQGVVHGHLPITENYDEALRRYKKVNPNKQTLARTRERNKLFHALKTVITRVFQDISNQSASSEILENCYVETPRDSSYEKGLDGLLRRKSLDMGHAAKPISVTKKEAGGFQKTVESEFEKSDSDPEVLLILGGIGVGKTTFIHRFRKVLAREDIDQSGLWAYVDFNKYSDTGESMLEWVIGQIWESLDSDYAELGLRDFKILKQAYHVEYETLKRGRLAPLFNDNSVKFEIEFGKELGKYEQQPDRHLARMLSVAAKRTHRRPFLVFDNADQFPESVQDKVFKLAQKLAKDIGCASVISLREESYWKNKDHGTLSAFHAISYQVQPPRLEQVISKRFKFAQKLLSESEKDFVDSDERLLKVEELSGVLDKIVQSILGQDSRYMNFLEYLSPFEIRRPLEFLSRFLVSGHTNMDALLRSVRRGDNVTIGFHEFFTSIALGDREYYKESSSDIVNLFAVDGREDASNLNRIAILGQLMRRKDASTPVGDGFMPVHELISECENIGISPDTTRSILALFNAKRLVETEAQDKETIAPATFVRATVAAQYYLEVLIYDFAYIDAVLSDTSIGNENDYEKLKKCTDQLWELRGIQSGIRLKRLKVRLDRAKRFLYYIEREYKASTLRENIDNSDSTVKMFFENASGKFLKQIHDIEKKAEKIFS